MAETKKASYEVEGFDFANDSKMAFFAGRIQTFSLRSWPHSDKETCSVEKMADAGFYLVENGEEDDTRCYYCRKEMGGWEPEDDPWEEHKRSADCPLIKKGKLARSLTVRDAIQLEADRIKFLSKKRSGASATVYREEADKMKKEIIKLGTKTAAARRGRKRRY